MQQIKSASLALLLVTLSPLAANAVPIVQDGQCVNSTDLCVFGIDGLEVMGDVLDVTFVSGAYDSVFATNDPYYLGNNDGANAAAAAIVALLDGLYYGVIGDGESSRPDGLDDLIFINTELTSNNTFGAVLTNEAVDATAWGIRPARSQQISPPNFDLSRFQPDGYTAWAVFTPVPEPGTLALLGIGLAGIGFARRSRRV